MSKKKPADLADILKLAGDAPAQAPEAPKKPQKKEAKPEANPPEIRQIQGGFDASVYKQFGLLALENDTTKRGLLAEAINDIFKKYGKPQIAE